MAQHTDGSISIEALETWSDYAEVRERFSESFADFVNQKKLDAVLVGIREEFPGLGLPPAFIQQVMARLNDDTLTEKRYIFLALNNRYMLHKP